VAPLRSITKPLSRVSAQPCRTLCGCVYSLQAQCNQYIEFVVAPNLPTPFDEYVFKDEELRQQFPRQPLKRAFALARRVTGDAEWEAIRQRRTEDLLVYMALARFGKRPALSQRGLRADIRAFFGTYAKVAGRPTTCCSGRATRAPSTRPVDADANSQSVQLPNSISHARDRPKRLAKMVRVEQEASHQGSPISRRTATLLCRSASASAASRSAHSWASFKLAVRLSISCALADVLAGDDLAAMLTGMRTGDSAELRYENGTFEIVRDRAGRYTAALWPPNSSPRRKARHLSELAESTRWPSGLAIEPLSMTIGTRFGASHLRDEIDAPPGRGPAGKKKASGENRRTPKHVRRREKKERKRPKPPHSKARLSSICRSCRLQQ
jgi:hypothetical protein